MNPVTKRVALLVVLGLAVLWLPVVLFAVTVAALLAWAFVQL